MKRLYSPSTGTTYFKEIHNSIPADAIPISDERYQAVITNAPLDKIRSHDADGLPILIDPPPPTANELATAERRWRDAEIESVRWLRERHRDEVDSDRPTTLTAAQSGELLDYVQGLRDWPQSEGFPDVAFRPVAPSWIAEQIQ
jgi:hypothetical protein